MTTLIFDIDGTLTDMWPIEQSVLLAMTPQPDSGRLDQLKAQGLSELWLLYTRSSCTKIAAVAFRAQYRQSFIELAERGKLPTPKPYQTVSFISENSERYKFVFATGGLEVEAKYVLSSLGLDRYFDLERSTSRDTCIFSKATGIPFRQLAKLYPQCLVVTDGDTDMLGAKRAKIPAIQLKSNQRLTNIAIATFLL